MNTVWSFTGIYEEQSFWREASADAPSFYDLRSLSGTSGYLSDETLPQLADRIDSCAGVHFIDTGNTHYMTKLYTDRIDTPFVTVLFDHHPDMQLPAFGGLLSCGSWLRDVVTGNPCLREAWLIGVDPVPAREVLVPDGILWQEPDDGSPGILQCRLAGRTLRLIPEGSDLSALLPALLKECPGLPLYLSVDKDVLSPAEVTTTWDQGSLTVSGLCASIGALIRERTLLGADICGDCAVTDDPAAISQNDGINAKLLDILRKAL